MEWCIGGNSITEIQEGEFRHYVDLSFNAAKADEFDIPIRLVLKPPSHPFDDIFFQTPWERKSSYGTPKVFFYDQPQKTTVVAKEKWLRYVEEYKWWPLTWPDNWKVERSLLNTTTNDYPHLPNRIQVFQVFRRQEGVRVFIWIPPTISPDTGVGICVSNGVLDKNTDWLPMYAFRKIWPRKPLVTVPDYEMVWEYILDNSASGAAGEMTLELSVQTMVQQAMATLEQQTMTNTLETTVGFKVMLPGKVELSGSQKMSVAIALMKQLQQTKTTSFQLCQKITLKASKKEIGKYRLELPFKKGIIQELKCTTLELSDTEKIKVLAATSS